MAIGTAPNDVFHNGEWYNRDGKALGDGNTAIAVVSSRPTGRAQVGDVITLVPPDGVVITSPGIFINKGAGYVSLASALTFTLTSSELPAEGILWSILGRGTVGSGDVLESDPIYTGRQVGPTVTVFPKITGVVQAGTALTVVGGTFAGFPAPTVVRSFWLNDELVWIGASYTMLENSTNSVVEVRETATNAVGSVTVSSGGFLIFPADEIDPPPPILDGQLYVNSYFGSNQIFA